MCVCVHKLRVDSRFLALAVSNVEDGKVANFSRQSDVLPVFIVICRPTIRDEYNGLTEFRIYSHYGNRSSRFVYEANGI